MYLRHCDCLRRFTLPPPLSPINVHPSAQRTPLRSMRGKAAPFAPRREFGLLPKELAVG
ncbi:MAG: hypothetical protein ACI3ZA_06725 [Alloprevotella sp.]